jgi:hypothetical protein
LASSLPRNNPSTIAEPVETRILSGRHASVIAEHQQFLNPQLNNKNLIFISLNYRLKTRTSGKEALISIELSSVGFYKCQIDTLLDDGDVRYPKEIRVFGGYLHSNAKSMKSN